MSTPTDPFRDIPNARDDAYKDTELATTRERQAQAGLRSTPAAIKTRGGETVPARVVTPAWTRAELESMARRQAEWGNITREQADREIAEGRRLLRADGTPRATRPARTTRTRSPR
jgi:hypothetical protein